MRVLFINPSIGLKLSKEGRCMNNASAWGTALPPYSLASCASVVLSLSFDVKIIDCAVENISFSELKRRIQLFQPDLIVLNTATPSINEDLIVADFIKHINPLIKVALIGIHPSVLTEEVFIMSKNVDFIIKGEPEFTLKELALSLFTHKPLNKIQGIAFREGNKIIQNKPRQFIKDLDSLPLPAWHLIDKNKYQMILRNKPFLIVNPARGCPYNCLFCTAKIYYGQQLRLRSPKLVVDEIEWIKKTFEINDLLFWTESFTLNKNFVMEVCNELLKRHLDIFWVANSRVDNVDLEMLQKMKQAGCWLIGFGIESGNQTILNLARKGITLQQTIHAIQLAKKAGLKIAAHSIIGLSGETKQTAWDTFNLLRDLDVDFPQFYCAVPFPGSDLYNYALKNKLITGVEWSKFNQNISIMATDSLSPKQIMKLRQIFYLKYYFRPKKILSILRQIHSFSDFKQLLYAAINFLKWAK